MVDIADLKSAGFTAVRVRVPSRVQKKETTERLSFFVRELDENTYGFEHKSFATAKAFGGSFA